jgi:hypothetical protein
VRALAVDSGNNLYAAIQDTETVSDYTWVIKKYAADGTEDTVGWDKTVNAPGRDIPEALVVDSTDHVYAIGVGESLFDATSNRDWRIKKYASDGTEVIAGWDKAVHIGHSDQPHAAALDAADNLYVVGSNEDGWMMKKFGPDGTEDPAWNISLSDGDEAIAVAVDLTNDWVYVVGSATNLADADSGPDWWLHRFATDGTPSGAPWPRVIDACTGVDEIPVGVAVAPNHEVTVVGHGTQLIGDDAGIQTWMRTYAAP